MFMMEELYLLLIILLGLVFGSFLNVVVYRIPRGMSIVKPRSFCPNCGKPIAWYDNIPLLSFLILHGKCRSCGTKISIRYFLIELINAVLWSCCWLLFFKEKNGVFISILSMGLCSVCLIIACIDYDFQNVYDIFTIFLMAFVFVLCLLQQDITWRDRFIGGVFIFLLFFFLYMIPKIVKKEEWMGFGDVQISSVLAFLLGWGRGILFLCFSSFSALLFILISMRGKGNEKHRYPFVPFLVLGFLFSYFFGTDIMDWYFDLFL